MFEDSLVESRLVPLASSKRWTTLTSISLQVAIAATLIALPFLHPETLPFHIEAPKVSLTLPVKPPIPVVRVDRASRNPNDIAAPSLAPAILSQSLLPSTNACPDEAPPTLGLGSGMGTPEVLPAGLGLGDGRNGPSVSVTHTPTPAPVQRIKLSSGVSQGMLITPIRPVYPAIAKAAHVEGMVVIEAVISRTGAIESLHIVSGPPMLQSAAIDAIRAARYEPYRLNGEPTEVQTTITVYFRIGG